ncbi:MAG: hypothetical protein Q9170_006710, partial [Blastenia crenularia]
VSVAQPTTVVFDDTFGNAADIIASATKPQIEPQLGFLKELGLDFGWGPTALLEWTLEHIHVFLGTPWWASLALTAVALRLVMFKAFMSSSDNAARIATIQPVLKDVQAEIERAKQSQDTNAMMRGRQELRNMYLAAGIKMWRSFFTFIQIPLGYGIFRLTRNMADLPVPGLEDGGALWFSDLTLSDPTFLLPIATGVATHLIFRFGGELGANNTLSPLMFKTFMWGLPVMSIGFTAFWPAAMQIVFATTASLSFLQSLAFRQAWFRNLLGMHPMPSPGSPSSRVQAKGMVVPTTARPRPQEPEAPKQGLIGNVTSRMKKFVEQNQKAPLGGRTKGELSAAQRYEEKRRREIQREKYEADQERQRRRYGRRS